jgi:hypothetical protein
VTSLRPLTRDDVTITVEALPEDSPPEGHFASGDDEFDRKICAEIREKAEWNSWAWCCIKVTVSWRGHSASDYLGACSYDSKEEFVSEGGYYDDMVDRALEELNDEVRCAYEDLKELEVSPSGT